MPDRIKLSLPAELKDRVAFLSRFLEEGEDVDSIFLQAFNYFDKAVCCALEGGQIIAQHKDGSKEKATPALCSPKRNPYDGW